jgi:hypothetical protein
MNLSQRDAIKRHMVEAALGSALSTLLILNAAAQEGHFGIGHDKWHHGFYDQLLQKDGSSCCNHVDCRPTQSRLVGNHYEVKGDGKWVSVPKDKIIKVLAPDGGAHVCASHQLEDGNATIFCVVLPPEG